MIKANSKVYDKGRGRPTQAIQAFRTVIKGKRASNTSKILSKKPSETTSRSSILLVTKSELNRSSSISGWVLSIPFGATFSRSWSFSRATPTSCDPKTSFTVSVESASRKRSPCRMIPDRMRCFRTVSGWKMPTAILDSLPGFKEIW